MTFTLLLATLLTTPEARAADDFAAPGLLRFLPAGEIVGDGLTPVAMHFLALAPDGHGLTGLDAKVTATEGEISAWTDAGDGWYTFTFTPPKVDGQKVVSFKLKAKTADKQKYEASGATVVLAPTARRITIAANPPQLTLGREPDTTLSFVLEGTAGQPLAGADLVFSASVGEIQNLTDMGGGRFTAKYLPPKSTSPQVAVITAADRRDPGRTYGAAAVPLHGTLDYKLTSKPKATVLIKVGGRDFGPVTADGSGRATVPLEIPAGVSTLTVLTQVDGASTSETVDARLAEGKRLEVVPVQAGLPADGQTAIPVRVAVRNPDGTPDTNAKPVLFASVGSVGDARHEGDGVYVATYTAGAVAGPVKLTASLNSAAQNDATSLLLVPPRAAGLTLTAEPSPLPAGPQKFRINARVTGPGDVGLAQRIVALNVAGAKVDSPMTDQKAGSYKADLTTIGNGPVEVLATVQASPTGNPLRRVLMFPTRETLPNDGISSTMLTVIAVDEFGSPVAGVPVTFKVDRGDGSLPPTATTGPSGLAQVFYTAGRNTDLIEITALAGDHRANQVLMQVPSSFRAIDLPVDGTESTRALAASWATTVTTLRVDRAKP
jgi:adhesin/invasin